MSIYSESRHKSRKVRRCEGCWWTTETNPIQVGQFYWSCFVAEGGDASSYSLCEACHDFLASVDGQMYLYDCNWEWSAGDLIQARKDWATPVTA